MSKLDVKNVKKMSFSDLRNIIDILNITVKGTGSNGRVLKRDMVGAITTSQVKKVGLEFTTMMPAEVIQTMLKKMDLSDIFNFCRTNKKLNNACTNMFWREIAQTKLKEKELGKFKNWAQLVLELKYGPNDLYTIGKKYQFGLITKPFAEQKLDQLIENDNLDWKGAGYDVESQMVDHLTILHDNIRYYGPGYEEGRTFDTKDDFADEVSDVVLRYDYTKNEIIYDQYKKGKYLNMMLNVEQLLENAAEIVWENEYDHGEPYEEW